MSNKWRLDRGREHSLPSFSDEDNVQEEQSDIEEYIDMLAILEKLFNLCI